MTHADTMFAVLEEDARGDLVDIRYYCAQDCAALAFGIERQIADDQGTLINPDLTFTTGPSGYAWPSDDGDTFCAHCGAYLMVARENVDAFRAFCADVLRDVRTMDRADIIDENGYAIVDVRAQYVDGSWEFHSGSPDYDLDHRGAWGYESLDLDADDSAIDWAVWNAIESARAAHAERAEIVAFG